jgi:hypothetical protein
MKIYTIFSIIFAVLLTAIIGANPLLFPVFYGLVFVGMLPSHWACERDLEEKWAITLSNFIILIGQIIVLGMIFDGIVSGILAKQLAIVASSNLFTIFILSLSVMWLGLLFFSIWCGYPYEEDEK